MSSNLTHEARRRLPRKKNAGGLRNTPYWEIPKHNAQEEKARPLRETNKQEPFLGASHWETWGECARLEAIERKDCKKQVG
jgi:hypothetical protein